MRSEPDLIGGVCRHAGTWQPVAGAVRAPGLAGRLRAVREADDDAQTVLWFVQSGAATHAIDPAEVVWIIDLAPGDGERAWRVLNYLSRRAPRSPPLRYLACCPAPEHHAGLAAHPFLQPWLADGTLFLDRQGQGIPSHPLRNPIVVLAHDALSAHAQGLYAAQRGDLSRAWSDGNGAIDWRAAARRDGLMSLLAAYRQSLNHVAFTLPHGAMRLLAELLRVSGGRMLLRASDRGAKDISQIRMGALAHIDGQLLRVNFEALGRWHRANGASVYQSQRDDEGRVLHLALHDIAGGRLQECLPEVLGLPHPDDHTQLLQALHGQLALSLAQCLAVLHAQAGDPRALAALSPQIAQAAPTLAGTALSQWRQMLACCWAQHYPPRDGAGDTEDLRALIATLASQLEDWPLARKALRAMLRTQPRDAASWYGLAQVQARTGGARAALLSLRQADVAGADPALVQQATQALIARTAAWRERPAYSAALARDRQLVLEPLDDRHALAMHHQYRDPQIAAMTRLPAFADVAALRAWITGHAGDRKRLDCAVLHAEYGLVGTIGAHWHGEGAFMHFWIGADHQGKGLAARVVRLMLNLLTVHGMRHVFAAVYPDNYRSLRTLKRLGFAQLPMCALAPENSMMFLAWAAQPDTAVATRCDALRTFSCAVGSVFRFADIDEPMCTG